MRYYRKNNKHYLSITEIIGLRDNYKDWEEIKNNFISKRHEKSWIVDETIQLGNLFHDLLSRAVVGAIRPPKWFPYPAENVYSELTVFNTELMYAGTIDLLIVQEDKIIISDLKTVMYTDIIDDNKEKYKIKIKEKLKKTAMQLCAYKECISLLTDKPISCECIVYDPYNGVLVTHHSYSQTEITKGQTAFNNLYLLAKDLEILDD